MGTKIFTSQFTGEKVLVAPLDWGLGHATRCIPLIHSLNSSGCHVTLAASGSQAQLLATEFPEISIVSTPGYHIKYGKNLGWKLLLQAPGIHKNISKEHKWLQEFAENYDIDTVISDNRYGLYNKKIRSIFLTHQLRIKSPFGIFSENLLQLWNYRLINRFDECWIPDFEGVNNLAGDLSHPKKLPSISTKYIGPLSRFTQNSNPELNISALDPVPNHLLFILSGPEPQRTSFENKILDALLKYNGTATVVRGLPESYSLIPDTNHIQFHNHLPTQLLKTEIEKAEFVIARSGYSTVMDMVAMQKKSILIPTPGQTEQEYLSVHLNKNKIAYCVSQKNFELKNLLSQARMFEYRGLNADR